MIQQVLQQDFKFILVYDLKETKYDIQDFIQDFKLKSYHTWYLLNYF